MKKVLVYLDKEQYDIPTDSTSYLIDGMRKNGSFEVELSFEPDQTIAQDFEIIMCRFDLPLKKDFLRKLHDYDDGSRIFINPPLVKLDQSTKKNMLPFLDSDITPRTIISKDLEQLLKFAQLDERTLIAKPHDLNKGKGIEKYNPQTDTLKQLYGILNRVTSTGTNEAVLQDYIEGVEKLGDKRITVFGYEPICANLRLPTKGGFICNFSSGGTIQPTDISPRDIYIVETIKPYLKRERILWAGIDVIGDHLIEINVDSPGGLATTDIVNDNNEGLNKAIYILKNLR